MEDAIIQIYQNRLKSQETWTPNELAEFFGVSHTTIRNRIKDGIITATEDQTEDGKRWRIPGKEIARNLSQEERLQKYIEDSELSQGEMNLDDQDTPGDGLVRELYETIGNLREQLGEARGRIEALEKENKQLRAELERRPTQKALPAKIEQGRKEALQQVGKFSTTLRGLIESWMEKEEAA